MPYIIVDKEETERLRNGMRENMRRGHRSGMRTDKPYHEAYREGYRHGWEDCDEEVEGYRRDRDSLGRFV